MGRAAVVCLGLSVLVVTAGAPAGGPLRAVPRWRVTGEGRGLPAVRGSTAYFLTKRHDVIAVDVRSGAVRWRQTTGQPGEETLGSSVVASGNVVVAGDYTVIGLDAATGAVTWRFDPPLGYAPGLYLGDAAEGVAFAGSPAGRLYAIDIPGGGLRWSAQTVPHPQTTIFPPVAANEVVAAGYTTFGKQTTGGVVVVDRASGRERWTRQFPRGSPDAGTGFGGGPLIVQDLVVAASGDGRIYGLDRGTGDVRWVLPPVTRADGRTADRDWRALAVSGARLIAGSVTGIVTTTDMRTGKEQWRYAHPEGGSIALRIAADDRSVYVPHLGGLLVALDTRDGHPRWEIGGFNDGFSWAPAIVGDSAYVAASRTGLFALPR